MSELTNMMRETLNRGLIERELASQRRKRQRVMYIQIAVVSFVVAALVSYYLFNIL